MARRNRDADPSSSLRNVRNAPGVPKGAKRDMRLAVIGLGRMGANISLRLMRAGQDIVGFDRNPESVLSLIGEGVVRASSLEDICARIETPRIFWLMLPAGRATEE